jgi:SSS family solute:Na+ symporter
VLPNLGPVDYSIISVYFLCLIVLGFVLSKRASASLEDYFLGGRRLPWWALGISGMASHLDMTGTMLIVSFLYMLGPRGLFIEFRGGAVLIMAVILIWGGKWHHRSRCMTGAEWMIYRFGSGIGGDFARIVTALATITGIVAMLAYLMKGVGLFLSMFLPFSPMACTRWSRASTAWFTRMCSSPSSFWWRWSGSR